MYFSLICSDLNYLGSFHSYKYALDLFYIAYSFEEMPICLLYTIYIYCGESANSNFIEFVIIRHGY